MNYKYNLDELVKVNSIIKEVAKVIDRINKQDINLYQVERLEPAKDDYKKLWFAEHELEKIID